MLRKQYCVDQSSIDSNNGHTLSSSELVLPRKIELNQSLDACSIRQKNDPMGLSFYRPPNNDYMWK